MLHERPGWSTPLEEVEVCPEAVRYEAAGLHVLAQQAQAAASNLADRFHSVGKEPWGSYFAISVPIEAYRGSTPPDEIVALTETVRKQGASSVYYRIAKTGEVLVLATIPTTEGDKHIRVAQWAPEGLCTTLGEIKHAERITTVFTTTMLALGFVVVGFMVYSLFVPNSDDTVLWILAAYVPLAGMGLSGRIRRRLIGKSRHARAAMP
jgi:hypothetical protein